MKKVVFFHFFSLFFHFFFFFFHFFQKTRKNTKKHQKSGFISCFWEKKCTFWHFFDQKMTTFWHFFDQKKKWIMNLKSPFLTLFGPQKMALWT
jgi:hypothetical protein